MRIFGIAIVKNEADIMRSFLRHVSTWAHRVYVYDNGSTDGTWEIAQEMANEIVVPWKSEDVPFHNGLRSRVFNEFRHHAQDGDWWCDRMDADEFYFEDPRIVLSKMPRWVGRVARKSINYYITQEDLNEYKFTGVFEEDREKIRYCDPKWGVEARFSRHHHSLVWNESSSSGLKSRDPLFPLIMSRRMIRVQHYQYRSPQQIQKRLKTRHQYKYRKGIQKGRIRPSEQPLKELTPDAWQALCPLRARLIEETGAATYDKLKPPKGMKHVHESVRSFLKKRTKLFVRPIVRAVRPVK